MLDLIFVDFLPSFLSGLITEIITFPAFTRKQHMIEALRDICFLGCLKILFQVQRFVTSNGND
jgi:hypothetical protein